MSKFDLNDEEKVVWRDAHFDTKTLCRRVLELELEILALKTKLSPSPEKPPRRRNRNE